LADGNETPQIGNKVEATNWDTNLHATL
jgi:hypothetical protein